MPPELRLLRYFVAVAEELSFTRAAERTYVTQPSFSAAIRQLEHQLGAVLLTRDARHVELTAAGRALLPHARESLAAAERGAREAREAAAGELDVLRVLYTQRLEPIALNALDRLEAREPPVLVTARGVSAGELVRELREGRADVGVIRFAVDNDGLDERALGGDPACVLVAEELTLPLAGADRSARLSDLGDLPVVTWAPELGLAEYNAWVTGLLATGGVANGQLVVRRFDESGWLHVAEGRAFAMIGSSERAPGGTKKVRLRDAPRMPLFVTWAPTADPELVDKLVEAVQLGVDSMTRSFAAPAAETSTRG